MRDGERGEELGGGVKSKHGHGGRVRLTFGEPEKISQPLKGMLISLIGHS
jgi:hypothetical protein